MHHVKLKLLMVGMPFKDKVECWLLGTEMPYMCSVSNDTIGVGVSSGMHVEKSENVQCGDVMGRACSSVGTSSRGSCSSRVRKSRVKVQLARLVLCHEKERLRESYS